MELRRFKMLGNKNAEEFFDWCEKKKISREDLIRILTSIELNPGVVQRDIRNCSVKDLINELAHRENVEAGNTGLYQGFKVKRKYSNDRTEITDAAVVIVHHLVF